MDEMRFLYDMYSCTFVANTTMLEDNYYTNINMK